MNLDFHNNYTKYFLWNEGLIKHFFSKGKSEIHLHVDKKLIEEIGINSGIQSPDHIADFSLAVENFCKNYNKYICTSRDPNDAKVCQHKDCKYHKPRTLCLTNDRRNDILAVAYHILSKDIKYYAKYENENGCLTIKTDENNKAKVHALPFFAIVIYLILKFDNGETQQWNNVEGIADTSRRFILDIWDKIHKYDKRFDPNASCRKPNDPDRGDYVGKILYHLPLSTPTRKKIHDAIYKSSAWKFIDSKSFLELVCMIQNSLKQNTLNEINDIIVNDYNGISARILQDVIDTFDIDEYKQKIATRSEDADYNETIISGSFALGIYLPEDEFTENSIVLLTTIQQEVHEGGFHIHEGSYGSLANFNTNFVEYDGSTKVDIKPYSLKSQKLKISPLAIGDVIFFYKYDENLYIQTRHNDHLGEYIIAVRCGSEHKFEDWCKIQGNSYEKFAQEDTRDLFGERWIVYSCDHIKGNYYTAENNNIEETHLASSVVMKGGLRNSGGLYFINSLPYFEVPPSYDISRLEVYINLNGKQLEAYSTTIIGRKFIIDIPDMPIDCGDIANLSICLKYGDTRFCFDINACGQAVLYDHNNSYKFDKFGRLAHDGENFSYQGSFISDELRCENISSFPAKRFNDLQYVTEDFYFTNLLAACCYNNPTTEITHNKFRKCVSYAATRLNIDILQNEFIGYVKKTLNKADIIRINGNKCQAVAPSFTKAPYSPNGLRNTEYLILSGCYTRSFIADLIEYCKNKKVSISYQKQTSSRVAEKFLPPLVFVGHRFDHIDFKEKYGHQFEFLADQDYAASLLNITPELAEATKEFKFYHNNATPFLNELKPADTGHFPRMRETKYDNYRKSWYIEKTEHIFAEVRKDMIPWASLLCHTLKEAPMIIQSDRTVIMPKSLLLPDYVERALYMMNLGLPEMHKMFIAGMRDNKYFTIVNSYNLHSPDRVQNLTIRLIGSDTHNQSRLTRKKLKVDYELEYWKENFNGKKQCFSYLLLRNKRRNTLLSSSDAHEECTTIQAIAHRNSVYINYRGTLCKIRSNDSLNEILTYIISENWIFRDSSVGISKDGGQTFEPKYDILNDTLVLPDFSNYKKENIQII